MKENNKKRISSFLIDPLGATLLGNKLTCKNAIRDGEETIRAGHGKELELAKRFLPHF